MKLLRGGRLHVVAPLPSDLLQSLGLPPSEMGSYKLSPRQERDFLAYYGLETRDQTEPEPEGPQEMYRHQRAALAFLRERGGRAPLFMEMRTGKSWVVLEYLRERGLLGRSLFLAPLSVVPAWAMEMRRRVGVDPTLAIGGTDRTLRALARPGPWILNYDVLSRREWLGKWKNQKRGIKLLQNQVLEYLLAKRIDALVLDESTRIKSWSAASTKATIALADTVKGPVVPLSGKPVEKRPHELWSQLRTLGKRPLDFASPGEMAERYCVYGGYGGYQFLGTRNLDELGHRLSGAAFVLKLADCTDLPEVISQEIPVDLTPREARAYKTMADESWAQLSKLEVVTADNVLAQWMKLRRIAGGYAARSAAKPYQSAKEAVLLDLIEDMEAPIVVVAHFEDEIESLAKALAKKKYRTRTLYGATPNRDRATLLPAFDAGEVDVLVLQPQTGGQGITLARADRMIFYSHDFRDRSQVMARTVLPGKKTTLHYLDLVARGTVDKRVLQVQKGDLKMSNEILDVARLKEWFRAG